MVKSSGRRSADARKLLQVYQSSLGHLEQHEENIRAQRHARLIQTKPKKPDESAPGYPAGSPCGVARLTPNQNSADAKRRFNSVSEGRNSGVLQ